MSNITSPKGQDKQIDIRVLLVNENKLFNINKNPIYPIQTNKQCFTKDNRLLNASMFSQVFEHARFRLSNDYILVLAKPSDFAYARLGLIVAKKKIPLAVNRNRFKRLSRESFRLRKNELNGLDIIIMARKDIANLNTKEQAPLFVQLLQKLAEKQRV